MVPAASAPLALMPALPGVTRVVPSPPPAMPCCALPFVACPPRGRWGQPASPPTPPAHLPQGQAGPLPKPRSPPPDPHGAPQARWSHTPMGSARRSGQGGEQAAVLGLWSTTVVHLALHGVSTEWGRWGHPHMTAPWCSSSGVSSPLRLPQNNVPFRWHVPIIGTFG